MCGRDHVGARDEKSWNSEVVLHKFTVLCDIEEIGEEQTNKNRCLTNNMPCT